MIIVLGRATIPAEHMEQVRLLSDQQVRRSRAEPGCVEHRYSLDAEQRNGLMFVERWLSMDHLQAHLALAQTIEFAKLLAGLSLARPIQDAFLCSSVPIGRERQGKYQ